MRAAALLAVVLVPIGAALPTIHCRAASRCDPACCESEDERGPEVEPDCCERRDPPAVDVLARACPDQAGDPPGQLALVANAHAVTPRLRHVPRPWFSLRIARASLLL